MSAPFVPALDTFVGGQMTDLPAYTGGLDLTALFEIVSPGNAAQGVNYSISIQQFIDVFLPAFVDFFNTSETLTTGAVPVTINPLVYLTKIISGGTGGTEVVIYPDRDNSKAGIPHAIEFITHTNPSDIVQLYGQPGNTNPIQGSPMGPLGPLTANTLLTLNAVSDGVTTTWGSNGAWIINGLVGGSTATFPNAANPGIPIVYGRNVSGAYGDYHDVTNPAFTINITSSTSSGSPTSDPAVAYATGIVSTGSAGDEFIALASPPAPGSLFGDAGIRHVIYYKTQTNPSDFVDLNLANIRNSDGTTFTSVQFLAPNDFMLLEWHPQDSTWRVIDGTSGSTSPAIVYPVTSSTDYFSTSETLTTGASPVSIDPTVFLTKITSGGTAGTEIVSFDDYIPEQSGKPHLIVFETQTDPGDVIRLYGNISNNHKILGSAFGPIGASFGGYSENTLLELVDPNDGAVLSWATDESSFGDRWIINSLIGTPTATFPNAAGSNFNNNAPSVMVQKADNSYDYFVDPSNSTFEIDITANAILGSAPSAPATVYACGVISTGTGAVGYINLETQGNIGFQVSGSGVDHVIYFKTRVNVADTISLAPAITADRIRNSDGSIFTSIVLSLQNSSLLLKWHGDSSKWRVIDGTLGMCTPEFIPPLAFPRQVTKPANYTVTIGDTGLNFVQINNAVIFQLPLYSASPGVLYTFTCGHVSGLEVLLAGSDFIFLAGATTSAGGSVSSAQVGASLTIQATNGGGWYVVALNGIWTVA